MTITTKLPSGCVGMSVWVVPENIWTHFYEMGISDKGKLEMKF